MFTNRVDLFTPFRTSHAFAVRLALALPVSIHCREAWDDLHAMLRDPVLARDCDHVSFRKVGNRSDAVYQQN
jgi:Tat protein secretion system quality control protein TatD with DNase activity